MKYRSKYARIHIEIEIEEELTNEQSKSHSMIMIIDEVTSM